MENDGVISPPEEAIYRVEAMQDSRGASVFSFRYLWEADVGNNWKFQTFQLTN